MKNSKSILVYLAIIGLVIGLAFILTEKSTSEVKSITYSKMNRLFKDEKVKTVNITDREINAKLSDGKKVRAYYGTHSQIAELEKEYILPQMKSGKIELDSDPPQKKKWYENLLGPILMLGVMIILTMMLINRAGGGGKAMSFGKSRARLIRDDEKEKITFADVAGLKEEKQELSEIVDFLKNPAKFKELGARVPKGVLLVGPPGTGKTYISKAAAGEADVPFYTISGSDFVEMFVGVGASRVRDLFAEAKKNAPCIVFIDEIDAVGRQRGAGLGGGHDEREQTLNQLLVEMDGFAINSGIIVLAATNRPDILDPALLRPGRFDRQVVIGIPDLKAREEIFKVHAKNKPLDKSVNEEVLARMTPGFTPADIENMLNEAALLTARRNGSVIQSEDIEEAITKVIAGPQKRSKKISDEERRLTAYHEAGHAILSQHLETQDPVHQITIIPRGMAGGFTMTLPEKEKTYATKKSMYEDIVDLLGGRVAEMLKLEDVSTGASNDIQRATDIARAMVTKYGFSDRLGLVNYSDGEEVFLGKDFSTKKNYSEGIASEIDKEIREIIDVAFTEAKDILTEYIEDLEKVAMALLELETINGDQFRRLVVDGITKEELVSEVLKDKKQGGPNE